MRVEKHLAGVVEAFGGAHPVWIHTIEHPDGRILVDTGMPGSPRIADVALVVNTHLHFDHCGGNGLYAGVPIHVQREAVEAAPDEYTGAIPDGDYVVHDGESEIAPGVRLLPTPGHAAGHQSVVIDGVAVVGGDVAYSFRELGKGDTEGRRRVLELGLETWLAHVERPKVPRADPPEAVPPPPAPRR